MIRTSIGEGRSAQVSEARAMRGVPLVRRVRGPWGGSGVEGHSGQISGPRRMRGVPLADDRGHARPVPVLAPAG